jgi:hypothetical protein
LSKFFKIRKNEGHIQMKSKIDSVNKAIEEGRHLCSGHASFINNLPFQADIPISRNAETNEIDIGLYLSSIEIDRFTFAE